jgi:hypothetical protein
MSKSSKTVFSTLNFSSLAIIQKEYIPRVIIVKKYHNINLPNKELPFPINIIFLPSMVVFLALHL